MFIPAGRNTGYHTHTEDSVSVNIVPADMTNQNLGSTEVTRGERAQRGRAAFTSYSKQGPRTHKATNIGQTPFHNVSFMFRNARPWQFTPSSRANASGYVQIMDNERVRGWRLAAGARTRPVCVGDHPDCARDQDRPGRRRAGRESAGTRGPRMDAQYRRVLLAGTRSHA